MVMLKKFICFLLLAALFIAPCAFADGSEAGIVLLESGAQLDLDSDGAADTVIYDYAEEESGEGTLTLKVNDAELALQLYCGEGNVYALTLADGSVYLLTGEYGYSDDLYSYVIRYGEGALTEIGAIGSLPRYMTVNGNVITAPVRGSKLHTWQREGDFVIAESLLFDENYELLPTEYYVAESPRASYTTSVVVYTMMDVTLKDSLHGTGSFVLPEGSAAIITATDDSSYIYLAVADPSAVDYKQGGYMMLGEGACSVIVDGEELFSGDVFDGLLFAD